MKLDRGNCEIGNLGRENWLIKHFLERGNLERRNEKRKKKPKHFSKCTKEEKTKVFSTKTSIFAIITIKNPNIHKFHLFSENVNIYMYVSASSCQLLHWFYPKQ